MNLQTLRIRWPRPAAEAPADEDLVAAIRRGETSAFEKLMRRYNQRLFRAARALLRDDAEAEDVVQETFVRAFRHLEEFEGRSRVATWLTRIAVNEALVRLKRARRFESASDDREGRMLRVESTRPGPEDETGARELRAVLTAAIDALPDDLRSVFVLREVEGMSTLEAAEVLQLTSEAVRVRLHRARAALRKSVEKRLGEEVQGLFEFAGTRCDRVVARVFARIGVRRPID
jgi:RNA polymerase sigma-70 factor (ECF subfamily)